MSQQPLFAPPPGSCACERCKVPLRLADPSERNPNARVLRLAKQPKGLCLECAVAEFFVACEMRRLIPDPKVLLAPHVQAQFGVLLKTGFSDAVRETINWKRVVEHWHLPFKGDGKVRGLSTAKEQDRAAAEDSLFRPRPGDPPKLRGIKGGKDSLNWRQ